MDWWNPTDWTSATWAAIAAWATFGIAVVAAFYAAHQVREARRTREDQSQPFVVIDLEASEASDWLLNLMVRNTGTTLARDVRFTFEPPLDTTLGSDSPEYRLSDVHMLTHGIPTLPPGKSVAVLFDDLHARARSELPTSYKATVAFKGPHSDEEYSLEYVLDVNLLKGGLTVGVKNLHDGMKALEEIRTTLKRWTDHFNGIRVYVIDRAKPGADEDSGAQ